jgi:hypothetical protein
VTVQCVFGIKIRETVVGATTTGGFFMGALPERAVSKNCGQTNFCVLTFIRRGANAKEKRWQKQAAHRARPVFVKTASSG